MLKPNKSQVFISGDAFQIFVKAVYQAIDNKDLDTFYQLNGFIYDRLSNSFQNDNIKSFEQFSGVFVWYYEYALVKLSSSISYKDIYDACADRSARGLKEKLGWWFWFYEKDNQLSLDEKKRINDYSRILLNRYAALINICLRKKDFGHLTFILNELQQSTRSYNYELYNLKWDIIFKKKQKSKVEDAELAAMEERYEVESFIDNTIRLLFKATLFWSLFLYQVNVITADELEKILNLFQSYRGYIHTEFAEDLIILRKFISEHEYAWGGWDYMERLSGVAYTPPSPNHWVTFGAVLYSLQNSSSLKFESDYSTPEQVKSMEYLLSSMIQIAKDIEKNGFPKWAPILGLDTEKKFSEWVLQNISMYERMRSSAITANESILADIPLDPQMVENLKRNMLEGWEKGNDLREVFKYFDKIISIPESGDFKDYFVLGNRNEVWHSYKASLVKDDNFNIPIFGTERTGNALADSEEMLFFSLLKTEDSTDNSELFVEIDKSINNIVTSEFHPSIVLCGYDVWRNNFQDLKSSNFVFNWPDKQGYPFANFGGVYKGLPVVYFRNQFMNNTLVVSDFKASFSLKQKEHKDGYQGVLKIDVTEITPEKAKSIIEENPSRWQKDQSEEDAIINLRNSILVNFFLVESFVIDNKEGFSIIQITT